MSLVFLNKSLSKERKKQKKQEGLGKNYAAWLTSKSVKISVRCNHVIVITIILSFGTIVCIVLSRRA